MDPAVGSGGGVGQAETPRRAQPYLLSESHLKQAVSLIQHKVFNAAESHALHLFQVVYQPAWQAHRRSQRRGDAHDGRGRWTPTSGLGGVAI